MTALRRLAVPTVSLSALALVGAAALAPAAHAAGPVARVAVSLAPAGHRDITFHGYRGYPGFTAGEPEGTRVAFPGVLTIGHPAGTTSYTDPFGFGTRTYEYGRWTSPTYRPGFGFTELVSSWNATTPAHTWLQMEMRGHSSRGNETTWYVMGRWASGDADFHRTSVPDQGDDDGSVSVDTFFSASGVSLSDYQLRVTLYREPGTTATPSVSAVGAVASRLPDDKKVPASPLGGAEGIELPVPHFSQDIHDGQYPALGGGGEAWCSPTSTAMVTKYWGVRLSKQDLSWVDPSYQDPEVDIAARGTYDHDYDGDGNWPFNVAYAAHYGLSGEVTQLRSLTEAEQFIKRGIPLITSVRFKASELPGSGYSTDGHLMVIVGFTKNGDVIANDPASADDAAVRHVYNRHDFENVWLPSSRSDGIVYVIHPWWVPLPSNVLGQPLNW